MDYHIVEQILLNNYTLTFNKDDKISVSEIYSKYREKKPWKLRGETMKLRGEWYHKIICRKRIEDVITAYYLRNNNIYMPDYNNIIMPGNIIIYNDLTDDEKFVYGICAKEEYAVKMLDSLLIESEQYTNETTKKLCDKLNSHIRKNFKEIMKVIKITDIEQPIKNHEIIESDIINYINSNKKFNNLYVDGKLAFYSIKN